MATKKIEDNIDGGLSIDDGDEWVVVDKHGGGYCITHYWMEPQSSLEHFDTLDELEEAMRELEPDLRKWRIGA